MSPNLSATYGKLPLSFEANQGQSDPKVKFLSRGSGYSLFLTDSAAVLSLTKSNSSSGKKPVLAAARKAPAPPSPSSKTDVIRMELKGSSHGISVAGDDRLPGTTNYFIGNDSSKWHTQIPTYAKVKYSGVYPGVDLVYYGNQHQLEYDFVVAPGADPNPIRLHFAGAKKLRLNAEGDLEVIARDGQIAFHKPLVYQVAEGRRQTLEGRFVLRSGNKVSFRVDNYDRDRELVIDPLLEYSTFLGGSLGDFGYSIAADTAGNAYVTGYASSTDFPVTSGAFQANGPATNSSKAFVTKLDPTGTALIYSTYLGGITGYGYGSGIAVDSTGDAYVIGTTAASDFPVTAGAFQRVNRGAANKNFNAVITELNPSGNALVYSTYLGGSGLAGSSGDGDSGAAIAVDSAGDAFVTGYTYSIDFPIVAGAFQTTNKAAANAGYNAFVTQLNPGGTALNYSTYIGGSGKQYQGDFAWGIAIDSGGNAYLTGSTYSSDYPITSGALQTTNHSTNSTSAWVTKLNPTGTALVYSTYLGGTTYNEGWGIAVDAGGNAYVTGSTDSADFPVSTGAFQTTNNGAANGESVAYITKLNPAGTSLVYSTFLGGTGGDFGYSLAIDPTGNAYVTGDSYSTDFPVTPDAFQPVNNGAVPQLEDDNAFVTEINTTGTALLYSTYLGGSSEGGEYGNGIAVDASGNAYVTGSVDSLNFPVTGGAFQVINHSAYEEAAFIAKFSLATSSTLTATGTSITSSANPQNQAASVTFTAFVKPTTGSGIPTGTVSFSFSGGAATSVALDPTGRASYSTTTLPDGVQTLVATYSGDSNYSPSNGSFIQTIIGPPSNIFLGSPLQSAQVGSVFPYPLYVYVSDSAGDPLSGITVDFSGSGLAFYPGSATTDAYGQASVAATATATGTLTATATVNGTALQSSATLTGTGPTALQFVPVTPCRVVDTRNAAGPFGGPEPAAGSSREFDIPQGSCSIPSNAVAYSLNTTVIPNGSLNYLTLSPSGQPQPNVSTLNSDGRVKANAAIIPAGVNGGVNVFVTDPTQVILDIDGYFVPAATAGALAFYPVTPCRIADTRNPAAPLGGPFLPANSSRDFPVQSSACNLPSTAQAYSLNVTAIPHTTLNYLTIWPTGQPRPNASTLNSSTGAVTANGAIVPAGSNGDVSVFVFNDADVILDINGYFAPPDATGLSLYTAPPCRVIDTRPASFNGATTVNVQSSTCAPPSTAEAYVLNATVVPGGPLIYLTLWPAGGAQPNASTLNADDAAITSNMAIVPTSNGSIDAFADGATNLILDFSGYFAP